jgi:copper(I)-binding protein
MTFKSTTLRAFLGLLALAAIAVSPASAHEYKVGTVKVVHPWATPSPAGAPVGAAYLEIQNLGRKPLIFLGASSPNVDHVEIHSMTMDGGIMKMRPMPDGLTIGPHKTTLLNKMGMHLMLVGVTKPLELEEMVPLTLHFKGKPDITVDLYVENSMPAGHMH